MSPVTSETWFDAIGAIAADIEGIERIYAGGKGGSGEPKVVPMARELMVAPVLVQGYGGAEITPGSWERQEHTLNCAIWIPAPADVIDKAYSLAIEFVGRVIAAYPPRSRAGSIHPDLQSALVTGFDAIDGREWGTGSTRTYVIVPYTIQAIVQRVATYVPG
jgi:hypothetical protein